MWKPGLLYALLALCGVGLLTAWLPDHLTWHLFGALIFGLVLVWTLRWSGGKIQAQWTWLFVPFLVVVGWGVVQRQLGWSVYAFRTEVDTTRWAIYLAVFFLAFQLSGEVANAGRLRVVLTTFAFALAAVSTMQYFLGNGKIFWLFETSEPACFGPFLNRDHYASFAALALPIAVVEMLNQPQRRWMYILIPPVLIASVIACASRAGFVCVALEAVIMAVFLGFSGRTAVVVVALILGFGLVVGSGNLYSRFLAPDPYAGRRELALATVEMLKTNPWKGFGLGTWTTVYPGYALKDFGVFMNAAHCDWLQWWAEGGAPMLGSLILLFGASLSLVRKVPWILGVPMVFLHGLVDFPFQGRFLPAIVFLVLGAAARSSLLGLGAGRESAGRGPVSRAK